MNGARVTDDAVVLDVSDMRLSELKSSSDTVLLRALRRIDDELSEPATAAVAAFNSFVSSD